VKSRKKLASRWARIKTTQKVGFQMIVEEPVRLGEREEEPSSHSPWDPRECRGMWQATEASCCKS